MVQQSIFTLSDIATVAQADIQQHSLGLDPIIGISRSMRDAGFPIDAMTIDCLKTSRRITFLVNDARPGIVSFRFGLKRELDELTFSDMNFSDVTASKLGDWIKAYFLNGIVSG